MALSETFGRADKPALLSPIENYTAWNTERSGSDKGGGGLIILYRESLTAHQWTPSVPKELEYVMNERQWLLINSQGDKKCAFLHCYIACQNNKSDDFLQWNEDLFFLITQEAITLRRQGFMILAMGDFNSRVGAIPGLEGNTPDTNRNQPMFMNFVSEVNLFIVNTLPLSKGLFTRFMGSSGLPDTMSLLDYGLVDSDHVNTVTSFVIDESARFDCGSDHALLECDIILGSNPHVSWAYHDVLQYDYKDNSDFTNYQKNLDQNLSSVPLTKFSQMESAEMLPHISESIQNSAMKSFGLKVKKKKKGMKLPKTIIKKIQTKNQLARTLHNPMLPLSPLEIERLQLELEVLKHQIKDCISEVKLLKRHRLRSKLLRSDPSKKKFWRFLKSQIKSAGSITALYKASFFTSCNQNYLIKTPHY